MIQKRKWNISLLLKVCALPSAKYICVYVLFFNLLKTNWKDIISWQGKYLSIFDSKHIRSTLLLGGDPINIKSTAFHSIFRCDWCDTFQGSGERQNMLAITTRGFVISTTVFWSWWQQSRPSHVPKRWKNTVTAVNAEIHGRLFLISDWLFISCFFFLSLFLFFLPFLIFFGPRVCFD